MQLAVCTHTTKLSKPVLLATMFPPFPMSYFDVDPPNCSPCLVVLCHSHLVVLLGPVATEVYSLEDVLRDTKKVKITKVRRMKSFDEAKQDGGSASVAEIRPFIFRC